MMLAMAVARLVESIIDSKGSGCGQSKQGGRWLLMMRVKRRLPGSFGMGVNSKFFKECTNMALKYESYPINRTI